MLSALTLMALKVLILAGGGVAEENHHSHLVHVQTLDYLLQERGVDPRDITLFWADGTAPGPDRGIIDEAPIPHERLIEGTALDAPTALGSRLENTIFPGRDVRPAKRAALKKWLAEVGPTLTAEDTLFVAVTDHGEPDPTGGRETAITLWDDRWTVSQMEVDLRPVSEDTRVVLMLSQCYSGGFADLARRRRNLCGSFSTHADRMSYGCYPHLAVQNDVGHFMHVTRALAHEGAIGPATDVAMLTDDSPDVPHLTSDAFLFDTLTETMEQRGGDVQAYVDGHLRRDPKHIDWQRLSRLSVRYGIGMVAGYGVALRLWDEANAGLDALVTWSDTWEYLYDHARDRLAQPLADDLAKRREKAPPRKGAGPERRWRWQARARAVSDYRRALGDDPRQAGRINALGARLGRVVGLIGHLEQQEAALVRAMYLLGRRAGTAGLSPEVRAQYAALQACETRPLIAPRSRSSPRPAETVPATAPLSTNLSAVNAVTPGFLGIKFKEDDDKKSVVVDQLFAGGPAATSELQVGDTIVNVDGWTLEDPSEFRASMFLATPGAMIRLGVRRATETVTIPITVAAAPLPAGPPAVGEVVPPLRLKPMKNGSVLPIPGLGQPVMLFFWATQCAPSKAALEPLARWAEAHDVQTIAVTSESRDAVEQYLATRQRPFPFPIGLDGERKVARLFAIEETPTFVFVDPAGRFTEKTQGFDGTISLRRPGVDPHP